MPGSRKSIFNAVPLREMEPASKNNPKAPPQVAVSD